MSQVTPNTGAMMQEAEDLIGTPYVLGGGHDGWDTVATLRKLGVDCSGFVSAVLHAGGYLSSPLTTQGLYDAPGISAGAGQDVTIYDRHTGAVNNEHTFIDIDGRYFMAGGGQNPNSNGAVFEMNAQQVKAELAGGNFQTYHPSGDPQSHSKSPFDDLIDTANAAANAAGGIGQSADDTAQAASMFVNFAEHPERALLTVALVAAGALLSFTGIRRMIGSQEAS